MMNLLKGCLTLLLPINSTPDLSGLLGKPRLHGHRLASRRGVSGQRYPLINFNGLLNLELDQIYHSTSDSHSFLV
ncbi:hypothetical protein QC760_002684 [Botrytis cinerea]|uniref:Uncharacterized protein n=1 Tax=Botryotinia fuckeliana (strain T4) TaxID=999810 RepID=G2Y9W2_BOTF4|nr:hypothetical protein BofuT4_uP105270.1 [Botrytis cinerea T4]